MPWTSFWHVDSSKSGTLISFHIISFNCVKTADYMSAACKLDLNAWLWITNLAVLIVRLLHFLSVQLYESWVIQWGMIGHGGNEVVSQYPCLTPYLLELASFFEGISGTDSMLHQLRSGIRPRSEHSARVQCRAFNKVSKTAEHIVTEPVIVLIWGFAGRSSSRVVLLMITMLFRQHENRHGCST